MASRKACLDRGKKKGICERYKNEKKKGKGNRRGMKKRTFKLGGGKNLAVQWAPELIKT